MVSMKQGTVSFNRSLRVIETNSISFMEFEK